MANITSCSNAGSLDPACPAIMNAHCNTDDFLGTYQEKWEGDEISSDCRRYAALNLGNQSQYVSTTDGFARRYLITDLNDVTFAQQGSLVYDPTIEDVVDVCQEYPGSCDNVLNQFCAGFTRSDLAENPNLAKLCGCFMSDEEYDKYTGSFGVEPICDPACVIQSTIKPRDPANEFGNLNCTQSVCVIDDVTISVLGQTTTGDINFAQACSACSGGGCVCSISDVSITAVESTIGNVNFDQNCGGPPTCFQRDATGIPREVPCSVLESAGGSDSTASTSPASIFSNTAVLITIGIIVTILILLILVALFFGRRRSPSASYQTSVPPPYMLGGGKAQPPVSYGVIRTPLPPLL
jgi:hypothetical protein